MSKEAAVILLGIWILVVPQLGVPSVWRTVLLAISGLVLIVIGLYLRAESRSRLSGQVSHPKTDKPFVESLPAQAGASTLENEHEQNKGGINSLN